MTESEDLEQRVTDLASQLDHLSAQLADVPSKSDLQSEIAAAVKAAFAASQPAATAAAPGAATSAFVPPIAPLNSAAGASPAPSSTLVALFPDIEPACISAVIGHTLRAADLYKLNPRIKEQESGFKINELTGALEVNVSKHKTYKSLESVTVPLHNFFAILSAHLVTTRAATVYFFRYLTHLNALAAEYEWSAVHEYHTLYFNRRLAEMAAGSYSGWAHPDLSLMASHVVPHRRAAAAAATKPKAASAIRSGNTTEICRKFNAGACQSPCPNKRQHVCSAAGCGKDHPVTQHTA